VKCISGRWNVRVMFKIYYKFFKDLAEGFRLRFALIMVMSFFAGILELIGITLIFPLINLVNNPNLVLEGRKLRAVYDYFGFTNPTDMVYVVAAAIGGIYVFKNIFMIFFQMFSLRTLQKWRNALCDRLMIYYMRSSLEFHIKRPSTELITNLNLTIFYVLNSFMFNGILLTSNIMVMLMLLSLMLYKFLIPTIISATVLLILTAIQIYYIRKVTTEVNERVIKTRAANLSVLTLAMNAIRETKIFQREKYFTSIFNESNARISRYDAIANLIQYIPAYSSEIVLVITVIVMSCLVLSTSYTPVMGMASLAVLAAVAFRLAPLINRSLFSYSQMRMSSNAAQNIIKEFALLEASALEPLEAPAEPIGFEHQLILKDLSFAYPDASDPALKNLNCVIKKGEFVGIVGESGAGKSTFADLILGLLTPTSGQLIIDDAVINNDNVRSLRSIAGYVSQSPQLFPTTLRQNIAFGCDITEIDNERVTQALEMASLNDFFKNKKDYLDEVLLENSKGISGGQRQRIAIARALYKDPSILVLDEATSALDVRTESEITSVINKLKGNKTIIAIAHRLSTLRDCDKIIYMKDGQIVDCGTFSELEKKYVDFSELLKLSKVDVTQ
jgi:ABC-type multidrug transport system fused ATPase/permease subunit